MALNKGNFEFLDATRDIVKKITFVGGVEIDRIPTTLAQAPPPPEVASLTSENPVT